MKKFKAIMKKMLSGKVATKLLSAVLSAVLLFYVIPTAVYAEVANAIENAGASDEAAEESLGIYGYNSEAHEAVELREESVKHFKVEDGSYVAAQYNYPVHYADDDGKWQDIDNTLASAAGGVFATPNARIKLAKKITGNETLFALKDGNTKLSFGLIGAAKGTVGTVTNGEDSSSDTELQKMMNLEKLSSSVVYENILPGADLEYVIDSLHIKENIIVKEKNSSYSYSFSMKLNGMSAELDENGDVNIYNEDSGEIQYKIPAPVVFDSAGAHAPKDAASYTLEASAKKYTLTVTVDAAWMNAEERVYPVTVDPTVSRANSYIDDTYIMDADGARDSKYGSATTIAILSNSIGYLMWYSLPQIPANAYVSNATIKTTTASLTNGNCVGVYEVLTYWNENLTWNLHTNGSGYNRGELGNLLDYNKIYSGNYYWNITSLVRDWVSYNNDSSTGKYNYGVAFKAVDGYTAATAFYSSEYSTASGRPTLEISYTVMKGVEDYWSYSSHSACVAGSGSVNLANGKLTFAIPTLSTTDSLIPYTPTLIYDSALANTFYSSGTAQCAFSSSQTGYGFKLNIAESVTKRSYVDSSGATVNYYVYADADGTEHAMLPSTTNSAEYLDEDGLGLDLTENSDGSIAITDNSKSTRTFAKTSSSPSGTTGAWYLTKISDRSGNAVIFTHNSYYKPTKVSIKPNGSSQIDFLELSYNSSGALAMILNSTAKQAVVLRYSNTYDGSISSTAYKYLKRIDFAYGTSATSASDWSSFASSTSSTTNITIDSTALYTYDSAGLLLSATDNKTNQKIAYEWSSNKITKISEQGSSTAGQSILLSYKTNLTELRTSGNDDIINNDDDVITRYVFDSLGRSTSIYSTSHSGEQIYGATTGKYDTKKNSKNNLTEQMTLGGVSTNYLLNADFDEYENNNFTHWTKNQFVSKKNNNTYDDDYYVELSPSFGNTAIISQNLTLESGQYTVSFAYSTTYAKGAEAYVKLYGSNSAVYHSERLNLSGEYSNGTSTFCSTTFKITDSSKNLRLSIELTAPSTQQSLSSPTIRIYEVMLSKSVGSENYNAVSYGSFENSVQTSAGINVPISDYWRSETSVPPALDSGNYFGTSLKIESDITKEKYAKQTIYKASQHRLDNAASNTKYDFVVSGFAKAENALNSYASAKFRIRVEVVYYQGANKSDVIVPYYFDFQPDVTEWQFVSGTFSTKLNNTSTTSYSVVKDINLYCEYSYQPAGFALFDNVSVTYNEIDGNNNIVRYEYNDKGLHVTSFSGFYTEYYEYDGDNNLIRLANNKGEFIDYTYSNPSKGIIQSETSYKFLTQGGTYDYILFDPATALELTAEFRTVYTFNSYGLLTKQESYPVEINSSGNIVQVNGSKKLIEQNEYKTTSGSRIFGALIKTTDSLGIVNQRYYDENDGKLLAAVNVTDGTGLAYSYHASGRLEKVTPASCTNSSYSALNNSENVAYTYDSANRLSKITTDSTLYSFTYDSFGNAKTVKAGSNTLATYSYNQNNGKLISVTYANSFSENYVYNDLELLSEIWYTNSTTNTLAYSYEYTSAGLLYKFIDHINGKTTVYKYDCSGRITDSAEFDSDEYLNVFSTRVLYKDEEIDAVYYYLDHLNGSAVDTTQWDIGFTYDHDGTLTKSQIRTTLTTGSEVYTYDDYDRVASISKVHYLKSNSSTRFSNTVSYTYVNSSSNTSGRIATYSSTVNGTNTTYTYTYDSRGNITKIQYSDGKEIRYYYDDIGQLVREDNALKYSTYIYTYDNAGNLTSKNTYGLTEAGASPTYTYKTKSYGYSLSNWGDLLTSINGTQITYDPIGNPLAYYNGETNYEFTWSGRQLVEALVGNQYVYCSYNDEGYRTTKMNRGVVTTFYLSGSQIVAEEKNGNVTIYLYDASGSPIGMQYHGASYAEDAWDIFWYEKNLQGDIIAVYNEAGTKLISYTYDAWGGFSSTYHNGGSSTVVGNNPFLYRGYYFDKDLQLYYLNARYYDPAVGRFVSADYPDVIVSTPNALTDKNLFAYCDNNPVVRVDRNGQFWDYVVDIGFLAWSVADVVNDPGDWKNWAALTVDVVFAVVPFVPSGVGQVIKVGNKIDNALDVANAINKVDNVQNVAKVTMIGRNMDRVTNTANLIGKADNLYEAWKGYDATATGMKRLLHNGISMAHNGGWLFGKLRQGYTVIDIGLSTMHKGRGLWYGTERFVLGLWKTRNIWKLPINYYF